MTRWLAKLQTLNQRWLYLATAGLLVLPLLIRIPVPSGGASEATKGLYEAIDSCPDDKVVWIDSSWDMGARAECEAQLQCVARHLCRKGARFVVTSVGPVFAPMFAEKTIGPIAREAGYKYGRDWVNCGYMQATGGLGVVVDGLCRDFHGMRPADANGTPVEELPLMTNVKAIADIHSVYVVAYAPSQEWISFVKGQHGTPVAFGCMSIMGPNYYTFLDSKQLCGMLVGNRGAAEYEELLDTPGLGSRRIMIASFGNCIIIAAAVLGNVGMLAAIRLRSKRK